MQLLIYCLSRCPIGFKKEPSLSSIFFNEPLLLSKNPKSVTFWAIEHLIDVVMVFIALYKTKIGFEYFTDKV